MAKKIPERVRLERELVEAEKNVGKYVSRNGCDYATFGYALDGAIEAAREFAVSWRRRVLAKVGDAELGVRMVRVAKVAGYEALSRTYRVYTANGRDIYAVYTSGSHNMLDRTYDDIPEGKTVEDLLRADGWRIER